MTQDDRDLLELLKFELNFLQDGGYGRSPHTPWRPQRVFEDSLTCPNFGDPARPHPCSECLLMRFVPNEFREQDSPCRLIPLTDKGETIDYFYRCGTQLELEEALAGWLRSQIHEIEHPREAAPGMGDAKKTENRLDPIRRGQWLAFAVNLYSLGNLHRENQNYAVAYQLYGRALAAAERIAGLGDTERFLVARIQRARQAVSDPLGQGAESERQASSEDEVIGTVEP